ncbi:hypothetical protein IFM89_003491 [Coptis chinensis]|uniref:Uncharacterized protein n=1 Tax=Coptis chinensis TaxID=261450 RepID=A0A835LLC7_9MAGN|nr:hypothetical protein IFM89_003491 [Coptis chinensis]
MGELATLAKARKELEDLYLGVPDESVNLTFQDFAELKQQHDAGDKKKLNMSPIDEITMKEGLSMGKSPSLDFSKAIHGTRVRQHLVEEEKGRHVSPRGRNHVHHHAVEDIRHAHAVMPQDQKRNMHMEMRSNIDNSLAYDDDISGMSVISRVTHHERGRRRPGIPHSNICTMCSTYIYISRNRCLVCGRVYCRHCVGVGMGEMTEGRKCVECLGRRFSQRYIHRAGSIGCCAGYPSLVKQQELKWAEKGPRRSGERGGYRNGGTSGMISRSRSPMTPRTPTRAQNSSSPNSFAMSTQFSPYSSTNPHIPY